VPITFGFGLQEDLEAQPLRAADILRRPGEPHFERAEATERVRQAAGLAHDPRDGVEAPDQRLRVHEDSRQTASERKTLRE